MQGVRIDGFHPGPEFTPPERREGVAVGRGAGVPTPAPIVTRSEDPDRSGPRDVSKPGAPGFAIDYGDYLERQNRRAAETPSCRDAAPCRDGSSKRSGGPDDGGGPRLVAAALGKIPEPDRSTVTPPEPPAAEAMRRAMRAYQAHQGPTQADRAMRSGSVIDYLG